MCQSHRPSGDSGNASGMESPGQKEAFKGEEVKGKEVKGEEVKVEEVGEAGREERGMCMGGLKSFIGKDVLR